MSFLKAVAAGAGICFAIICIALVIIVIALQMNIETGKNREIQTVLDARYPGYAVMIVGQDEGPTNQLCLRLELRQGNTSGEIHKVARVNGDLDSGSWAFSREYESMKACADDYFRG